MPHRIANVPVEILFYCEDAKSFDKLESFLEPEKHIFTRCQTHDQVRAALKEKSFALLVFDLEIEVAVMFIEEIRNEEIKSGLDRTSVFVLTEIGFDPTIVAQGYQLGQIDFMLRQMLPFGFKGKVALFTDFFRSQRRLLTTAQLTQEREQEKWIGALETISDAYISINSDYFVTYANRQAQRFLGENALSMIGQRLPDLFPLTDRLTFLEEYESVMRTGRPANFEGVYDGKDIEVHAYRLDDGGCAIFFRDVSERKKSEIRERMQRQKFEAIFTESPAAMALHRGPTHIFEILNPQYQALMGDRDILGKPFLEAMPEIQGQPFDDLRTQVFETGVPFFAREMKAKFQRRKGGPLEEAYFDFAYTRVNDGEGHPYGVYVHAIESTERVLARQKIEGDKEDQKFRAELGDRLARIPEVEDVIVHATRSLANRLGASRCFVASIEDTTHTATVHLDFSEDLPSLSGVHNLEGFGPKLLESWRNEAVVIVDDVHLDPRTIDFADAHLALGIRSFISIRILKNGVYIGVVNATSHLPRQWTPREAELLRSSAETVWSAFENARLYRHAQEAIATRDEFLSIASHELKTPVTSLKLQMQILARQLARGDQSATTVENLQNLTTVAGRQIKQLTRLIEDMLDVSRIGSGKFNLELGKCSVGSIVRNSLAAFSPQVEAANIALTMDLPADADQLIIHCDEHRLEQVFANLLTNALKYGEGKPIELSARRDSNFVLIEVADHGLGIHEKDRRRIFDRFERAISANEVSGLGLGLYISEEIVEGHDGELSVRQRPDGPGSIFTVKLPLVST